MSNIESITFRKLNEKKQEVPKVTFKPYINKKITKEENIFKAIKIKSERKKIWD